MANVLHRTSKVYLTSVNTPDYPEEDWVINPDLSAVENVPVRYWVVERIEIPWVPPVVEEGFPEPDPEPSTWVDVIREMTQEEKDAYDLANPIPEPDYYNEKGQLILAANNPMPAALYGEEKQLVSIETISIFFSLATTNSKNVYLKWNDVPSNLNGYVFPRPAKIKNITVALSNPVNSSGFLINIMDQETKTVLYTVNLNDGDKVKILNDLSIDVNAGQILAVYIGGNVRVAYPTVQLELSWRN